jgi:23S rRNA pseudouridine1911/1915/1917 synthase
MNTKNLKEQSDGNFELYEHYNITVDAGQGPMRIDKYLFNKLINISRNKIQQAAKAGNIIVNGESVKSNYKVRPLDVISVVMTFPPRDIEILPENIPLNIVYEDEDIILVNKQAGLVVHPAYANYTGTLLNGLAYHFANTHIGNVENGFGYLVHRIDKDTTGLLLIAKNELAQTKLAKQFFDHTVDRAYEAIVWKDVEETEGTIEGNIGRSLKDRRVMTVFPGGEYGKHAVSHYKVLRSYGYVTHVECRLETGRTHQIRAHFTYLGHPLFNDSTYGGDKILKGTTFTKYKQFVQNCFKILNRQALHARSLGFIHPKTGKKMNFVSDLPTDMNDVLVKWEGYVSNRPDEYN